MADNEETETLSHVALKPVMRPKPLYGLFCDPVMGWEKFLRIWGEILGSLTLNV